MVELNHCRAECVLSGDDSQVRIHHSNVDMVVRPVRLVCFASLAMNLIGMVTGIACRALSVTV